MDLELGLGLLLRGQGVSLTHCIHALNLRRRTEGWALLSHQ